MKRRKTAKARVKASRRNAPKGAGVRAAGAKDTDVAQIQRERDEALHQQAATAEILKLISASPTDTQPVFDAIVQSGLKIFPDAAIFIALPDGDKLRAAALAEADPIRAKAWARRWPVPITREYFHGVAFLDKKILDIPDGRKAPPELAVGAKNFLPSGYRAVTVMPMMRGRTAIGTLSVVRPLPGRLSRRQTEALKSYAAQAVIAIENTRLLNELRERTKDLTKSLEHRTATSEVLGVISSSVMDAQPVFDMIAENAQRLCGAQFCFVYRFDGELLHFVAHRSVAPEVLELNRRRYPAPPDRGTVAARAILERKIVQVPDVGADPEYDLGDMAAIAGYRSAAAVPILRDGVPIGCIAVTRAQKGLLDGRQIELLKTFADQAVIAIENARLLNELRQRTDDLSESLEQQTATSDVLKVISSSQGELETVFQTLLENATRICEAAFGSMLQLDGDMFRRVALHNAPAAFAEFHAKAPLVDPRKVSDLKRVVDTRQVVHVADTAAEHPDAPIAKYAGGRTLLVVPMLRDEELIGAIGIYRQEVRPFTDKQIELVKNFASQAVIAIENTRLLNELRELLQQQTATANVLKLISRSTFDLQAVLDTLTTSASRLCQADKGAIFVKDGDPYRLAAHTGFSRDEEQLAKQYAREHPLEPGRGSLVGRVAMDGRVVHIEDVLADAEYEAGVYQKAFGYRSNLGVPLLREGAVVGVFALMRHEVHSFSEKEIELVSTFANQAVIAIENARLLNELRDSLQQQTASAEVLKVISSSPGELEPVFNAILANATSICGAKFGTLYLHKDDAFYASAFHNAPPAFVDARKDKAIHPSPESTLGRAAATKEVAQVLDATQREVYRQGDPFVVVGADLGGYRTIVSVPMLKDDELVGVITIYRQEVLAFNDKQIELVKNFAAQAVIAIENARLLNELRESLQQQTATADVLKVISSSPGDLEPVFQAMLEKATQLCEAKFGIMFRFADGVFRATSWQGDPPAHIIEQPHVVSENPHNLLTRIVSTKQPVHSSDLTKERAYIEGNPRYRALVEKVGARSLLVVPMLKNDNLIGAIAIYWQEARSFTGKQMELISNFAAQAVIAIDNARLLSELRESLQQQTATSDVLKVISRSTFDLQTVLDTLVESAGRLCGAEMANIWRPKEGGYRLTASYGVTARYKEYLENKEFLNTVLIEPGRGTTVGRVLLEKKTVHIHDIQADPDYKLTGLVKLGGYRTMLGVPILREGEPIGVFVMVQSEVRPFTDKQIDLATTFADQAAIAIENVRLFDEVQTRTRDLSESLQQQIATADVLKVISRSTFDLNAVLRTLVESATRLCEAEQAIISQLSDDGLYRIAANYGFSGEFEEWARQNPFKPERGTITGRTALEGKVVHVPDVLADPEYTFREGQKLGGYRSNIGVPLLRDGVVIGVFVLTSPTVKPFTDKQIELVRIFADQAVIAIENARLLNELRELLQQQTATADVLKVISASPGNLEPVFQAILENATQICQAGFGTLIFSRDGAFRSVALHNPPPEFRTRLGEIIHPHPDSGLAHVARTKQIAHIEDIKTQKPYLEGDPAVVKLADSAGARTLLIVPMLKEGDPVGVISIYRQEVRPFADKQIELVQNFAAQAVIAIENTRLLNELREFHLQQQTATADVLKVISSSTGELQPVFEAMLENAVRICEAGFANLWLHDGKDLKAAAIYGAPPEYRELLQKEIKVRPGAGTPVAGVIETKRPVQMADLAESEAYRRGDPVVVASVKVAGTRSLVAVPMLKDNELVGAIAIYRQEVRPFTDKQIELVSNFAAQAVIAIENARLLNELRKSLQQQTATADVLKVISRSTFDLQAVLDTLVESAAGVCEADTGIIRRREGDIFRSLRPSDSPEFSRSFLRGTLRLPTADRSSGAQFLKSGQFMFRTCYADPDLDQRRLRDYAGVANMRSGLGVPLMREGAIVGVFTLQRREARPFTDKQIELVTTFADQAVIAIENVRLFDEVQARTRELAASLEDLRTAQDRLVQTQKLASLGQLTAGIAHEIKNPLNFVNNFSAVSTELIDELQDTLKGIPLDDKRRAEVDELTATCCAAISIRSCSTANAPIRSSRTCCCTRAKARASTGSSISMRSSRRASISPITAREPRSRASISRSSGHSIRHAATADLFPQEITRVLLNLISTVSMRRPSARRGRRKWL